MKPTHSARFPGHGEQVHVATAFDGRRLAVKVQHAGLRESCVADTTTIEVLVKAVKVVFPVRSSSARARPGPHAQSTSNRVVLWRVGASRARRVAC